MPTIPLHPSLSPPTPGSRPTNPLPSLLQTPTGLAILELQGTINAPDDINQEHDHSPPPSNESPAAYETPLGKLMFPDYSPLTGADDTKWMKRVYLYVGRYQRMTGQVKKLGKPLAVLQRRPEQTDGEGEELEIVEIVKYKLVFGNRPEPVNDG